MRTLIFLTLAVVSACTVAPSKPVPSGTYDAKFILDSSSPDSSFAALAAGVEASFHFSDSAITYRASFGGISSGDQIWKYRIDGDSLFIEKPGGVDAYLLYPTAKGFDLKGKKESIALEKK